MFAVFHTFLLWSGLGWALFHVSGLQEVLFPASSTFRSRSGRSSSTTRDAFAETVSTPVCLAWTLAYLLMIAFHRQIFSLFKVPALRLFGEEIVPSLMQGYNLFQVSFNLLWCVLTIYTLRYRSPPQPFFGAMESEGFGFDETLAALIWLHYADKFVEFFDTFAMIVRGKSPEQLSVLHVSHHAMMGFAWLFVLKRFPQGDSWFGAFVNSVVHVIMYSYYFAAAQGRKAGTTCVGGATADARVNVCLGKIATRFKKSITIAQLTQFALCFGHGIWCGWVVESVPWRVCAVQIGVMLWMMVFLRQFMTQSCSQDFMWERLQFRRVWERGARVVVVTTTSGEMARAGVDGTGWGVQVRWQTNLPNPPSARHLGCASRYIKSGERGEFLVCCGAHDFLPIFSAKRTRRAVDGGEQGRASRKGESSWMGASRRRNSARSRRPTSSATAFRITTAAQRPVALVAVAMIPRTMRMTPSFEGATRRHRHAPTGRSTAPHLRRALSLL